MAPIAPFLPYIISTFAGIGASKLLAPKSDAQKQIAAGPPAAPATPPSASDALSAAIPAAAAAVAQQKKQQIANAGRESTILTSPNGLSNLVTNTLGYKTIIGG